MTAAWAAMYALWVVIFIAAVFGREISLALRERRRRRNTLKARRVVR